MVEEQEMNEGFFFKDGGMKRLKIISSTSTDTQMLLPLLSISTNLQHDIFF